MLFCQDSEDANLLLYIYCAHLLSHNYVSVMVKLLSVFVRAGGGHKYTVKSPVK